jgi:hypothetical protein
MTDTTAGEAPTELVPPVPPVQEAAAEIETAASDAAPPQADAPAQQLGERSLPEIEHAIGPLRQAVLDHLLDTEGPQSVSQILAAMPPGTTRGSAESAIKREFDVGRIERVAAGMYRLAPPRPIEPPKPALAPTPEDDAIWFDALERWVVDRSWDTERLGQPPDHAEARVPPPIRARFADRLRKREDRAKDRAAALERARAADRELRDQLLAATGGNFVPGPGLDDVAPIRAALELGVPLDRVLFAIRSQTDLRVPAITVTTWRDEKLLRRIGEYFWRFNVLPVLMAAGKAQEKPAAASEPSAAVELPPEPGSAPASSAQQPDAIPSDELVPVPEVEAEASAVPAPADDREPITEGRDAVLARFARGRTPPPPVAERPVTPQPTQPPPRRSPPRPSDPQPQQRQNLNDDAIDELVQGWRAGNIAWARQLLGEEPGHPDCRLSRAVLRRNGLA